jgi:hypothetical protein
MFLKSTAIAFAAVAAMGIAISSASAKPGGPGIGSKMPGVGGPGIIKPAGGIKIIPSNPIKPGKPIIGWPKPKPKWPIIVRPRPIWYPVATPVAVAAPTYIASRPVVSRPGPCTCLSKEYTPQGQVLFKDRCTNEAAINPPLQQQGAVEAPQPQQTAATYQQQPTNMLPQQPVQ